MPDSRLPQVGKPERVSFATSGSDADRWRRLVGRAGFVAKGILYGLVGVIAVAVALGDEKRAADQTGALQSLGGSTAGTLLLVALTLGLGAYAFFRLVEAIRGPARPGDSETLQRIGSAVQFVIYGVLCVSAGRVVAGAGGSSGSEDEATSTVFDLPAGEVLVFVAGAVLVGVGLYQAYLAVTADFEDDLDTSQMSKRTRSLARFLGFGGHAGRAVVYPIVGWFLIKAAVEHDAKEAVGIDGALQELAQQTYGTVLLLVVAVGLVLYGAYCLIEARYFKV